MNQHRQPSTSTAVPSFATLPANYSIVQTSKERGLSVSNWEPPCDLQATFDSPDCEFLGAVNKESDYDNAKESCMVNTLRRFPPPNYADLFNN